ncbi:hypothetical protein TNCV_4420141 [Trichonephila clavipes]|nr:hypothetical protein TNCV_4420141 [Trichonephila clavipes]
MSQDGTLVQPELRKTRVGVQELTNVLPTAWTKLFDPSPRPGVYHRTLMSPSVIQSQFFELSGGRRSTASKLASLWIGKSYFTKSYDSFVPHTVQTSPYFVVEGPLNVRHQQITLHAFNVPLHSFIDTFSASAHTKHVCWP